MPKRKTILVEVQPSGPVTECAPIPVLVHLRYDIGLGDVHDHPAEAIAWTASEVLVRWDSVEVWLPMKDVRSVRQGQPGAPGGPR